MSSGNAIQPALSAAGGPNVPGSAPQAAAPASFAAQPSMVSADSINLAPPGAAAIGGPKYRNPDDGAWIVTNGPTLAIVSKNGTSLSYLSQSDSFMLNRPTTGERLGTLANGTIGVDEGGVEVALDKNYDAKVLEKSGKWDDFGTFQSPAAQQALSQRLSPQAFSDLTNTVANKGSLGWVNIAQLGFAPSSVRLLNYAQHDSRQEKVRAATVAREQNSPKPVPIEPLESTPLPFREGAPAAAANGPYLKEVESLSHKPDSLGTPAPAQNQTSGG